MVWAKNNKRNTKFQLINCNNSKSLQLTIRFFFLNINISLLKALWKCKAQNLNSFYSNGNIIILIPEDKLYKFRFSSYRGYRNTYRHTNTHMKNYVWKLFFFNIQTVFNTIKQMLIFQFCVVINKCKRFILLSMMSEDVLLTLRVGTRNKK